MTTHRLEPRNGILALPGTRAWARLCYTAGAVAAGIARWAHNRDGERQLSLMSDAQLRDLGITRGEINHVAWHGRD